MTFPRCSESTKVRRLDDAMTLLRGQDWKIREVFFAIKNGSDDVRRAIWDLDGSAEALVAIILKDAKP